MTREVFRMSREPRSEGLGLARLVAALVATFLVPAIALASGAPESGEAVPHGSFLQLPNPWAILSFLIVLGVLVWKLLPPIIQVMDRRAETIRQALEAAERARAEREALMASHARDMEAARDETRTLIAAGKAEAERMRSTMVSAAEKEAEEIAARARREVEAAKQAAVDELQRRAVDLAFDISSSLIRKSLNPAEHQKLIQEKIRDLPEA